MRASERLHTVNPRVTYNRGSFWQLKFSDLSFDGLIVQCYLFDQCELFTVAWTVHVRSQTLVIFHNLLREVDDSLMKSVLELGTTSAKTCQVLITSDFSGRSRTVLRI